MLVTSRLVPHGMCYSHLGKGIRNGAISIMQWGFISGCYKVKSIGQWGKILVMAMGFVDHLGQCFVGQNCPQLQMNNDPLITCQNFA